MSINLDGHLVFGVWGDPAPQGSKSGFAIKRGGVYTGKVAMKESSQKVEPWRESVVSRAQDAMASFAVMREMHEGWRPLEGPVVLRMVFSLARPKKHFGTGRNARILKPGLPSRPTGYPDTDKLARSTCDALAAAGMVRDDSQFAEYERLAKVWCRDDDVDFPLDKEALLTPGVLITIWPLDAAPTVDRPADTIPQEGTAP